MNETFYLVDNNVLVEIKGARIESEFFRDQCRVTEDVLWEARERAEYAALEETARPRNAHFLDQVQRVMHAVEASDTRLVDLYRNKGAADPGLIASVLEAQAAQEGTFFGDEWVIVSNDQAVIECAAEFEIRTMSGLQLAEEIDLSTGIAD